MAAALNKRSLTQELVERLESSFEPKRDIDWQLRVALHTNEARMETLGQHIALVQADFDQVRSKIEKAAASAAEPAEIRLLQDELQNADKELDRLRAKMSLLLDENAALERAKSEANREVIGLLDKLADSAMQEDLRDLHAREERMGLPQESRGSVQLSPEQRKNALVPPIGMPNAFEAYQAMLDETLAKRDEKIRSWWQKEFGYDPEAPRVAQPASKGPTRSANAPKPLPKKKP